MNSEVNPLISVVMSVYNGERYLSQSIESILGQTFTNFKFIIIDDGSKDNSLKIIKEYRYKDDRIKVIENKKNIGLPSSLNKGIKIAKGKYIARQDADDISLPNRLDAQYKYMENHPEIDILGSDCCRIDIEGNTFSESTFDVFNVEALLQSAATIFAHGTAFIRREVFEDVGLYNESFYYTQDLEYWIRCYLRNKRIYRLREFLYKLRITRSPREQSAKDAIKKNLSELLNKAFRSGLITGFYDVDTNELESILQYKTDEDDEDWGIGKKEKDWSGYWFFIARQALKTGKEGRYVRKCLYKSFLFKDHFRQHMIKMVCWALSYFNYDYRAINTSRFRKMWS